MLALKVFIKFNAINNIFSNLFFTLAWDWHRNKKYFFKLLYKLYNNLEKKNFIYIFLINAYSKTNI